MQYSIISRFNDLRSVLLFSLWHFLVHGELLPSLR